MRKYCPTQFFTVCHRPRSRHRGLKVHIVSRILFSSVWAESHVVYIHYFRNKRRSLAHPAHFPRVGDFMKWKKRKIATKKGVFRETKKGKAPIPPLQHLLHNALYNFVFERSLDYHPPSLCLPPHATGKWKGARREREGASPVFVRNDCNRWKAAATWNKGKGPPALLGLDASEGCYLGDIIALILMEKWPYFFPCLLCDLYIGEKNKILSGSYRMKITIKIIIIITAINTSKIHYKRDCKN